MVSITTHYHVALPPLVGLITCFLSLPAMQPREHLRREFARPSIWDEDCRFALCHTWEHYWIYPQHPHSCRGQYLLVARVPNKWAILSCDKWLFHYSGKVMKELSEHKILLMTYTSHTSHIFQVLCTLLIGRLKAAKKRLLRDLSFGCELNHVMEIFRAYGFATTSLIIWSSWEKADYGFQQWDEMVSLS